MSFKNRKNTQSTAFSTHENKKLKSDENGISKIKYSISLNSFRLTAPKALPEISSLYDIQSVNDENTSINEKNFTGCENGTHIVHTTESKFHLIFKKADKFSSSNNNTNSLAKDIHKTNNKKFKLDVLESGNIKERHLKKNSSATTFSWSRFRKRIKSITVSKLFVRSILCAILVNTITMSIEHHNQPALLTFIIEYSNWAFIVIFFVEMILKLVADGFYGYIKEIANVFDAVIVLLR